MKTSTLRPGLLVALSTSQRGNCRYNKTTTEVDHVTAKGTQEAEWSTRRIIFDPDEHKRASDARMLARRTISKVCCDTVAFGLLCPEDKAEELREAIIEAELIVKEFNATAKIERIRVDVLCGRIAPDDEEAVKRINREVASLMQDMQDGLRNLDVKAIREAAEDARRMGQMLTPTAQARVTVAIEAARKIATEIKAAGETAAVEIDLATIRRIDEQRVAFLDMDAEILSVAAPVASARAIDFDPGVDTTPRSAAPATRQLEL